jgi:hypothetical protein
MHVGADNLGFAGEYSQSKEVTSEINTKCGGPTGANRNILYVSPF